MINCETGTLRALTSICGCFKADMIGTLYFCACVSVRIPVQLPSKTDSHKLKILAQTYRVQIVSDIDHSKVGCAKRTPSFWASVSLRILVQLSVKSASHKCQILAQSDGVLLAHPTNESSVIWRFVMFCYFINFI